MRNLWGASLACLGLATLAAAPAYAAGAVLVPIVPYPDSSRTTGFSIDDNNILTGSYIANSDGIEQGFFGTLDGTYSSFNVGNGGTQPRGSNNAGYIMGFSNSQSGDPNSDPAFERYPNGKVQYVRNGADKILGVVQGVNNGKNIFTGSYLNSSDSEPHGYIGVKGNYTADLKVKVKGNTGFAGRGINAHRDVVGWFLDANGAQNGFILSGKKLTVVNYPDASEAITVMEGINDKGQAVGQWTDTGGIVHSFLLDIASSTFTEIDDPAAASFTQAWNVNNNGVVTISSDVAPSLWCATKKGCPKTGADVRAPVRVVAQGLPQFDCERGCSIPVTRVRSVTHVAEPKGLIAQ